MVVMTGQPRECTQRHWTVCLKTVKMVNVCTFYHIHTKSRTRTKQNRTGSKASNPSAFVAKTSKNSHPFLGTLCVPGSQPDGWKRLVWIRGGAGKAAWRRRVQWEAPNPSCVPWPWPWPWPWGWSLSPQWEAVWPPTVLCKWKPRTYFRVCEQENWKKKTWWVGGKNWASKIN